MPEKGFTPRQTAAELVYTLGTVYVKINKKQFNVRRYGRDILIFEEDNADLFARRRAYLASRKTSTQQTNT